MSNRVLSRRYGKFKDFKTLSSLKVLTMISLKKPCWLQSVGPGERELTNIVCILSTLYSVKSQGSLKSAIVRIFTP